MVACGIKSAQHEGKLKVFKRTASYSFEEYDALDGMSVQEAVKALPKINAAIMKNRLDAK